MTEPTDPAVLSARLRECADDARVWPGRRVLLDAASAIDALLARLAEAEADVRGLAETFDRQAARCQKAIEAGENPSERVFGKKIAYESAAEWVRTHLDTTAQHGGVGEERRQEPVKNGPLTGEQE